MAYSSLCLGVNTFSLQPKQARRNNDELLSPLFFSSIPPSQHEKAASEIRSRFFQLKMLARKSVSLCQYVELSRYRTGR